MISKEEANQLQKLTPSITAVHLTAAYITSGKISLKKSVEKRQLLNVFIVNDTDNEEVWIKSVL